MRVQKLEFYQFKAMEKGLDMRIGWLRGHIKKIENGDVGNDSISWYRAELKDALDARSILDKCIHYKVSVEVSE